MLRLKTLKPSILVKIQAEEKRQRFSIIFDGLMSLLPEFSDSVIESFIVDQASKISSDMAKTPEKAMEHLGRLRDFCQMLVRTNIRSVKDLPVTKPLKVFFADFVTQGSSAKNLSVIAPVGADTYEKEIDFADPHVYLKEIEVLDNTCLDGKDVSIKRVSEKLLAAIKLSLPLLDVAKTADNKLHAQGKDDKKPSLSMGIERILDMLSGDQARLHTRRIMKATRLVHDLVTRVNDAEQQRDSLQARHDKPWMYMITKQDRMPDDKFKEQMEWFSSEIIAGNRKLNHVMGMFKTAPECEELVDALEKLERHVDANIIENLNETILHIRSTGTRGLIVSKEDHELAIRAKINLDGILVTSDSPFPDLDKINADYLAAKEKLYALTSGITSNLAKRTTEEKSIVENGIMAAMLQIMKEYADSQRGHAGSGFLCMMALVQGAALDLLDKLHVEVSRLSLLVSERSLDPKQVHALVDAIGLKSVVDIVPARLEELLKSRTMPEACIDTAVRLLKYTPLSRDAYYSPTVTACRERITGYAANLKLLDAIFLLLFDIGVRLEEMDTFLPRKFIAMEDARMPTMFSETLDKWLADNMGRLFSAGGSGSHKETGEKIEAVKAKLENLQDLLISIPDDIFENVKPIPLLN